MEPANWISIDIESIKVETHPNDSVIELQFFSSLFTTRHRTTRDFVFGTQLQNSYYLRIQDTALEHDRLVDQLINQLTVIRQRTIASSVEVKYSIVDYRSFPVFIWTPWNEPLLVQCSISLGKSHCYIVLSQGQSQTQRVEKFYNHIPVRLLTLPEVLAQIDAELNAPIHPQARNFVLSSVGSLTDV